MGLTANEKKRFERLAQQLQIEFVEKSQLNHVELAYPFEMSVLDQMISFVEDMRDFESEEYLTADKQNILPIDQRKAYTRRVNRLASKAMNLKLDRSKFNTSSAPKESTWRFKTEIPVFESLEITSTCKTCSKRLWKSLFKSPFPPDDEELKRREERREYCKCTEEDKSDDYHLDHTMAIIIKDSIEPRIIHPPLLRVAIDKDLEPDYIAGLQQHRFNQYMENPWVQAQLQDQPVRDDNMIFPFMVAEAKKEDGDAWDYTYFQTVFPIYTMLSVQWRLVSANIANGHLLEFNPIVWFYAYRGQHWKLHLAYLDKSCEFARNFQVLEDEVAIPDNRLTSKQPPYPIKIVRVWEGDLTDENKAMQLLLIVDYMADWARDYYREMIKTGLQNLNGYSYLELIDSQKTDILSRINTRTSDMNMESNCGKLGTGENQTHYSANDSIPASIPECRSCRVPSDDQPRLPLMGASSPSNVFLYSRNIQMPQQSQLQEPFGDPKWPYQGISQSLSEPQTPIHDASLAFSDIPLSSGIPYAEPWQVALEPLPSQINNNLYLSAGNPYLGVPQSARQLQQPQSINDSFLPGSGPFPIDPQIVQQPQPPYGHYEFPSAGNQYFGASQAVQQSQPPYGRYEFPSAGNQYFGASQSVQQSQPEMYPTSGRQLDLPVRVGPIRTPSSGSRWDESTRTRSQSPRMSKAARQSRGVGL